MFISFYAGCRGTDHSRRGKLLWHKLGMKRRAFGRTGLEVSELVHVGDRDHNDVKGSQALGAKAILFTASRDNDRATTSADAICERHADLPAIVDRLAGG